jgi:hypothetical protein
MDTIWLSPTGFISGDPTLQISYPFVSHPGTVITCTAPGDLKWISIGLHLLPDAIIEDIIVSYELSSSQSFISQVRLTDMTAPNSATVLHDDPTPLKSTTTGTYTSHTGGLRAAGAATVHLRLNFQNVHDEIRLGPVGAVFRSLAQACVNSLADLKAFRAGFRPHATVLGYHAPGDGGGGAFYWDERSREADDSGTIIIPASNPPMGRWKRLWSGALNVQWFGARGDWNVDSQTGSDDYDALQAAAAAMNARGGGTLIFPPGRYRIDRYKIIDGPNKNNVRDIVYQNCSGLHIVGFGAKIDIKDDFHRAADYRPNQFWYSYSNIVQPFWFRGCTGFRLEGFELNGNVDKMTRDSGVVESMGYGIITGAYQDETGVVRSCQQYSLSDLYIHHFQTDGVMLGFPEQIADRDAVLINVRSLYNARNALSIENLRGGVFTRCDFSQSGRAVGTYGGHSPQAGLDIEPEATADVPTGDLTFVECAFVDNGGSALSASGGESLFKRCLFWGTDYYSIIANARNLTFEDCEIYGECVNWFKSSVPHETTKYIRCHFEDNEFPGSNAVFRPVACVSTSGGNVQLDDCVIIANKTKGVYLDNAAAKHQLRATTIIHKHDGLTNGDFQSLLRDCIFDRVHFAEDMKNPKGWNWYLDVSRTSEVLNQVIVDGPFILWADENTGGRLNGKAVGNNRPFPRVSLELNHNMDPRGPYEGFGMLGMSSAPPASGSWNTGDVVLNQAPIAGGKIGWVCVAGGNPGTWCAFGQIDVAPLSPQP